MSVVTAQPIVPEMPSVPSAALAGPTRSLRRALDRSSTLFGGRIEAGKDAVARAIGLPLL